jgi:hypothetical protein
MLGHKLHESRKPLVSMDCPTYNHDSIGGFQATSVPSDQKAWQQFVEFAAFVEAITRLLSMLAVSITELHKI